MKIAKTLFSILLLSSLFFCTTCRKKEKQVPHQYPEDPATTTLTPRERLTGSWRIYSYQFKGKEIIANIDTINNGKEQIEKASIAYDYSPSYSQWLFYVYSKYYNFQSETAFDIDNPYYITIYGSANSYLAKWFITPFKYNPKDSTGQARWTITKLYEGELNLVLGTDSGDFRLFLKRI